MIKVLERVKHWETGSSMNCLKPASSKILSTENQFI